ncbi:hypothetical protein A2215_00730 [Candidatus Berkelbacteria bacterium RIFOXYA2_FULL_43_10]|uniref:Glycosyltransferase RgtA/B/C/D-like domain-containing protein n=1 Tax=Candidatus Berkelbacteria bacterium RIFOXYA2_FULL_43_10 TaxID=1797472 RepID=A0A1F5EF25_9BACT|nr:MAG: hypothetical protein A2215_00730 [Candidatus Berkelbacteria bacterium RIFOXYA2_FULL_43_10]
MWKNTKYILLLGLAVRVFIAPFFSSSDISVWYQVISDSAQNLVIYDLLHFSYPPLWGFILSFWGKLFVNILGISSVGQYVSSIEPVNALNNYIPLNVISPWLNLIIKIPIMLADFAIAWLIYSLLKDTGTKIAKIAVAFWLLNPLVISAGYILGQFDSIPALFMLLALIFFWKDKRFFSGVSLSIGILFKLYPAFVLPAYLAVLLFSNNRLKTKFRNIGEYCLGLLLPIIFVILPMMKSHIWIEIFSRTQISEPMGINFWFYNFSPNISRLLKSIPGFVTIESFAPLLALMILIMSVAFIARRHGSVQSLIFGQLAMFTGLMAFLYQNSIPQYFLFILILLIVIYFTDNIFRFEFFLLSIVATLFYFSTIPTMILANLYPLAVYTNFISPEYINDYLLSYALNKPVSLGVYYNFVTLYSGLGFSTFVLIIFKSLRYIYEPKR